MPSVPPSPQELDAYREGADRFIAELDEEYYLHFAGLKDSLELESIYERHAGLTELERAQALGAAVDGDRRIRELWRFSCEGYFGRLTREHAEKLAGLEAELEATVDGETVPFRMLRPEIANEPDRGRRQRLDAAMWEATEEHLNPVYEETVETVRGALPGLGASTYLELYARFGLDLKASPASAAPSSTRPRSCTSGSSTARCATSSASGSTRRSAGTSSECSLGPVGRRLPSRQDGAGAAATLADLGIDLDAQSNVHLDIEQRPQKTPRAFCAPIEVPGKVMLVIQPIGGADDWRAFFHEAGHAEHFANTAADLEMEYRRLGDSAVTEGWAMLLHTGPTSPPG